MKPSSSPFSPVTLAITTTLCMLLIMATAQNVSAQRPNKLILPALGDDQKVQLGKQAATLFSAIKPTTQDIAKSTVTIGRPADRLAFGIVVKSPHYQQPVILTKWSEVSRYSERLFITTANAKQLEVEIAGVYPEHDLTILRATHAQAELIPVDLNDEVKLDLGDFITLARHDGKAEGFGVVSVKDRNLSPANKGYLGISMRPTDHLNNGIYVQSVSPNSAAEMAGLTPGDIITAFGDKTVSGPSETRVVLQSILPGSKITIHYTRNKKAHKSVAILGSRADQKQLQRISSERMNLMESMGTELNYVRSNFPSVIQTDIPIEPIDVGSPAINLDGEFVGLTIARASRIKTYIIPAATIRKTLAKTPLSLQQALHRKR